MKRLAILIIGAACLTTAAPTHAIDGHSSPLVIPAAAFHNNGVDPDGYYFHPNGYLEGDGALIDMWSAVHLPNGATIERITLRAVDDTNACAIDYVGAQLYRGSFSETTVLGMHATVVTTGASSVMQSPSTTTISEPVVQNLYYQYYIKVELCSQLHDFYAVEIEYSE